MKNVFAGLCMIGLLLGCSQDIAISPAQQLVKDVAAIDKYLAANSITAIKDPSGLRYVITGVGTGGSPTGANFLKVKYRGTLLTTGAVFDQSANYPATPTTFFSTPLSGLIQGWQIAFANLSKGSVATLYIPSGLAYGTASPSAAIPANSNLVFDVTLIDFK